MKRCVEILTLFLLLQSFSVNAQTITNSERRTINSRILNTIEYYESFSSLYDDEAEFYFQSLFKGNSQAMVFCDIMGMPSYLQNITVSEYISLLRSQSQNTVVTLKDVSKGEMVYDDGEWSVPITLRKSISYIDQRGYVFSVDDYHKTDFSLTMNLRYNKESDFCYIDSISGELISEYEFPKGRFFILEEGTAIDNKGRPALLYQEIMTIGGKHLTYNEFGQAIFEPGEPSVSDPDVDIYLEKKAEGYNYDVVSYRFVPRNTRLRLRCGFAPFAYSVKGLGEGVKNNSNAIELGVDLGVASIVNESTRFSFNVGVGLSMSNLNLKYAPDEPESYTYKYTRRLANGLYKAGIVDYQVIGATEGVRYIDLFVPVYIEYEHNINSNILLSWNFGVKGYYGLSAKVKKPYTLNATASIDGGEVSNVVLASKDGRGVSFIEANTYAKNIFEISAMANVGADIIIDKEKRIYAMARIGYERGMNSYKSDTNQYLINNPIVYGADGSHIAVNSMISGMTMSRNALWISAGVKFKL